MIKSREEAFEALRLKLSERVRIDFVDFGLWKNAEIFAFWQDDYGDGSLISTRSLSDVETWFGDGAVLTDRFWKYNSETGETQPCLMLVGKKLVKLKKIKQHQELRSSFTKTAKKMFNSR